MQLFVLDDVSDSNQIKKLVFVFVFDAVTFSKAMLSGGALNVPVCSLKISSTLGVLMRYSVTRVGFQFKNGQKR